MATTPYQTANVGKTAVGPAAMVGLSTSDTLGFLGTTPVAKQGGAALATISIGTITSSTPYGFASKADGDYVVNQVKALTAALAAYGAIKQA